MSDELIVKSLLLMKAAYPRQTLPEETIDLYTRALQDIEPRLLKTAVMQHIATSKWFPTIAELRGTAAALVARTRGCWRSIENLRSDGAIGCSRMFAKTLSSRSDGNRQGTTLTLAWRR